MDAGGLPIFSSGNQAHQLNNQIHLQQHQQLNHNQFHQQQQQQQQPPHHQLVQELSNLGQPIDNFSPKKQTIDRLKKRLGGYRQRQSDCVPRYDQAFNGVCEQQNLETNALQKRFLESKAKRAQKKPDKKQLETLAGNLQSSVHVVSLFT